MRADSVIISIYRDFDEVGLYSLAYRILELSTLLGAAFLTSIFPVMARRARDGRLRQSVQVAWDVFVIAGAALAACGAVLAPELVRVAGGSEFAEAAEPLRVLLPAGALAFVNGVIGYALIAVDRQRRALWLNATGLGVNVALNLVLVPPYGIVAAAVVTLFSELLVLAGGLWLAHRHLGFLPNARVLPAALAAAGVTAAVLALMPDTLALLLPVALLLYPPLVLALSPARASGPRASGGEPARLLYACPRGPRDSTRWYLDADPMEQVDGALVDFVAAHARAHPCSTWAAAWAATPRRSRTVASRRAASTSRPSTWSVHARWGWRRTSTTGSRCRTRTAASTRSRCWRCWSTWRCAAALLREARRVARRGVLVSVPNSTQDFHKVPIEFSHMLDTDHRHWFTVESLDALLREVFGTAVVEQAAPVDELVLGLMLPRPLRPLYRGLRRAGAARPRFYSRLLGRAPV